MSKNPTNLQADIEALKKRIRRCQAPRGAGSNERAAVECERNRLKFQLSDLESGVIQDWSDAS